MTDFTGMDRFNEGYALAKEMFNGLASPPATSEGWVSFFREVTINRRSQEFISGAAAFITEMEVKEINLGQVNRLLSEIGKGAREYSDMREVLRLLPHLGTRRNGKMLKIPVELRPDYHYDSFYGHGTGKLGGIRLSEVGMKMILPCCTVYDKDDPEKVICQDDRLNETKVVMSELLSVLQTITDPEKKNQTIEQAIIRCRKYEENPLDLPSVLRSNGIGVVHLSGNGWHRVNHAHVHAQSLYAILDADNHVQVYLDRNGASKEDNPFDATEKGFGEISGFIREGLNRARHKA